MHQNKHAFASSPVSAKERSYINTSPMAVKRKTHCPDRAEEPIKWPRSALYRCSIEQRCYGSCCWNSIRPGWQELQIHYETGPLLGRTEATALRVCVWVYVIAGEVTGLEGVTHCVPKLSPLLPWVAHSVFLSVSSLLICLSLHLFRLSAVLRAVSLSSVSSARLHPSLQDLNDFDGPDCFQLN